MTADFGIQRRVLEVLCQLSGVALREAILLNEVAMLMPRTVFLDEIRTQLTALKDSGLVETTKGPLGETRWRRTPQGEAALKDMQA